MKNALRNYINGIFGRFRDRLNFISVRNKLVLRKNSKAELQRVFNLIYKNNYWGFEESVSGEGSLLRRTRVLRRDLPKLVRKLGINKVVDAACGDLNWMKEIIHCFKEYVGIDIVPEIIELDKKKYEGPHIHFLIGDVTRDPLPHSDAVICRDVLVHFTYKLIYKSIENMRRSKARYLILTNDRSVVKNTELPKGIYRPLNFRLPPFSFPEPLVVIHENRADRRDLCVWKFKDIPRH